MGVFKFGKGENDALIYTSMLNRHGLISGATGSGKTVTLKVLAENLSKEGIPVFLSDIKGDLASLSMVGERNEKIVERLNSIGLENYENRAYPVELFDVYEENGIPLRTTISEIGPVLLSMLLNLNDVQAGILNMAFVVADEKGYFLYDIKDLKAMLNYLYDNRGEYERKYGNITKASVGSILRALTVIETQGGDKFFGEPAFDVRDLFRLENQMGVINILDSRQLFNNPALYSTFLLWLLSEIYESLDEVGDLEKPKFVFFFDEAHILFEKAAPVVLEQVEMVVRLIRSKGVGIFFVTQNPTDIPDDVLSQCGNKIQHQLRANTPKELKLVKNIADSYKQDGSIDLAEAISSLKTGEAVVSTLDEKGQPGFSEVCLIAPPESSLGTIDEARKREIIGKSIFLDKYVDRIDSESAYEMIEKLRAEEELELEALEQAKIEAKEREEELKRENLLKKEAEKKALQAQREAEKRTREFEKSRKEEERRIEKEMRDAQRRKENSLFSRLQKNVVGTVGREIGRNFARGIFGIFKK